jgi:hypothetical protein
MRRFLFSVLLGLLLTPLAGFFGALAIPGAAVFWLIGFVPSVFLGVKAAAAMLAIPTLFGASFAWPVTCLVLPTAGLFWRPATAWSPLFFAGVAGLTGGALTYLRFKAGFLPTYINPINTTLFSVASIYAGVLLGALFGLWLWRFDRRSVYRNN